MFCSDKRLGLFKPPELVRVPRAATVGVKLEGREDPVAAGAPCAALAEDVDGKAMRDEKSSGRSFGSICTAVGIVQPLKTRLAARSGR